MRTVLVTGANGFIGAALAPALRDAGFGVRTAGRSAACDRRVASLGATTDWRAALAGVDAVVHLAGPAHARYSVEALQSAIADGTAQLAAQAASAGVQHFVFVSSIKACAEQSQAPLREGDIPAPADAYGQAKLAAERALIAEQRLTATILRPPLVYAPNAKGNFARLLQLAHSAWPLPLAAINNRRSFLALQSLIAAVLAVLRYPQRAAGVFHLADEPALSTTDLIALLRRGMGHKPQVLAAPLGSQHLLPAQLRCNLEVDSAKFRSLFPEWSLQDVRAGLIACAAQWRAGK